MFIIYRPFSFIIYVISIRLASQKILKCVIWNPNILGSNWVSLNFTAPQSVRVNMYGKNH